MVKSYWSVIIDNLKLDIISKIKDISLEKYNYKGIFSIVDELLSLQYALMCLHKREEHEKELLEYQVLVPEKRVREVCHKLVSKDTCPEHIVCLINQEVVDWVERDRKKCEECWYKNLTNNR